MNYDNEVLLLLMSSYPINNSFKNPTSVKIKFPTSIELIS